MAICPIAPITPIGSTPFREGIKAGIRRAERVGGGNTGGVSRTNRRRAGQDFCRGFTEGWKSVKGNISIVPICPLPPLTPIGSTPYQEGIKAGVKKADKSNDTKRARRAYIVTS